MIVNPNPAAAVHLLVKLLEHLTAPVSSSSTSTPRTSASTGCGWHPSQIHLFGYGQGGTCAGELALAWAKARLSAAAVPPPSDNKENAGAARAHLGSLVAVSAPLLSYPTPASDRRLNRMPVLLVYRPREERNVDVASWVRSFVPRCDALRLTRDGEGMLRGRDEWMPVMRFWSEVLGRKSALELSGEVYEVTGGAPSAPGASR